jgi:polar amino acid transport system permease protein
MSEEVIIPPAEPVPEFKGSLFKPHRIVLMLIALTLVVLAMTTLRWDWLPSYGNALVAGVGRSLAMLFSSAIVGFLFAVLLGIGMVAGPWWIRVLSRSFCSIIRGTPLLLQLWLLYYGLGSVFSLYPDHRHWLLWPYLREAWPYGFMALMISFAGYEGEVMRGAFAGVPRGELEAARAYGMSQWTLFRRIWLPRAVQRALPTLNGETVLQLKSTPLVATVTVVDVYGVVSKIRQDTFLTYEPLLLLALIYMTLTGILVAVFRYFENKIPVKM